MLVRLLLTRTIILALSFNAISCGSADSPKAKFDFPDDPKFSDLRAFILEPKCGRCHVNLNSYNGALGYLEKGKPQESELYTAVKDNWMPPNGIPLSSAEKQALYNWISKGAKYE